MKQDSISPDRMAGYMIIWNSVINLKEMNDTLTRWNNEAVFGFHAALQRMIHQQHINYCVIWLLLKYV